MTTRRGWTKFSHNGEFCQDVQYTLSAATKCGGTEGMYELLSFNREHILQWRPPARTSRAKQMRPENLRMPECVLCTVVMELTVRP